MTEVATSVSTTMSTSVSQTQQQRSPIIQFDHSFMAGNVEIYAHDDYYFYGKRIQQEDIIYYSISKITFQTYIQNNETGSWDLFIQQQPTDINLENLLIDNNNMRIQMTMLNAENMRLKNEVIIPLQNSLIQSNLVIQSSQEVQSKGQPTHGYATKLQKKNSELMQQITDLKREIAMIKMDTSKNDVSSPLSSSLSPLSSLSTQHIYEIEKLKATILSQEHDLDVKNTEMKRLTHELTVKTDELTNRTEELTQLNASIEKIRKDSESLTKLKTNNTTLMTTIEDRDTTIQALQIKASVHEKEMNRLKSSMSQQVSQQVERMTSEKMSEITKELSKLRSSLSHKDNEMRVQQTDNKKLTKKNSDLEERILLTTNELKQTKIALTNIESTIESNMIVKNNHIKELLIDLDRYRTLYKNVTTIELVKRTKAMKDMEANYYSIIREMDLQKSRLQFELQMMSGKLSQSEQRYNELYEMWKECKRRNLRENGEKMMVQPVDIGESDKLEE